MRSYLTLMITIAATACTKGPATDVELSRACDPGNEKKYIAVTGYLDDHGSIFCSNTGGRMDCSLDFVASPGGERVFGADIEQGSSASEIEKLPSGYKREDLKIRDAAGAVIRLSDKVKVTGEMNVGGGTCFMEIDKIEKAQ